MEPIRIYNLQIDANDLNIIAQALGNMPYRTVAPLINKLQEQIIKDETKEENDTN